MRRVGLARPTFTPRPAKQWTANELPGSRVPFARVEPPLREIVTITKDDPTSDEAYRRLVAALPCINCGIEGYSQAAHGPTLGAGIKCSDEILFPLCTVRVGVKGCHERFDQYELFDADIRRLMAMKWAAETRLTIEGLPA